MSETTPQLSLADEHISKETAQEQADRQGTLVVDTAVAARNGAYVTIQLIDGPNGKLTSVNASGANRRQTPIVFDEFQLGMLIAALGLCRPPAPPPQVINNVVMRMPSGGTSVLGDAT